MSRRLARLAALGLVAAAIGAAPPARADFYSLAGRFQCLDKPDGSCGGPGRADLHMPVKPKPAPKETAAAAPIIDPLTLPQPTAPKTKAATSGPYNPVEAIAAAVKHHEVSSEELATLRRLSQTGNAHATELLAWCDYKGIGVARDPVAAYVLYGIAAMAGIPRASANQTVIYEYALTSDQRQKVLDIQNEVMATR